MTSEDLVQRAKSPLFHVTISVVNVAVAISFFIGAGYYWRDFDNFRRTVPVLDERVGKVENALGLLRNDFNNMRDDFERRWKFFMRRSGTQPKKTAFHRKAVCAPHRSAVKQLLKRHKEQMVWRGQIGTDWVMELFVSPSGSWTLLNTGLNGVSCVRAAGHSSEFAKPKLGHPGI